MAAAQPERVARPRLDSLDALRGVVMVLMALDHTRDFFSRDLRIDATDPATTYPALFWTRWVTHFCAPVFLFLAGTGAFLSSQRGRSRSELSGFLLTRGLWCVGLELTVIRSLGWMFNFDYHQTFGIVFWAIGWSMVCLSGLIHLPLGWVTGVGVGMIFGHNLLDGITPEGWGSWGWLWRILHAGGEIDLGGGYRFGAGYPLIPWIGVMAAGWGFGTLYTLEAGRRRIWLMGLGLGCLLLFLGLRATNLYGDPKPWSAQAEPLRTLFSFLNCNKYPPSLLYLLMTLGPAFILLALLERGVPSWLRPAVVFGRVPLFYYLLHLPMIHGAAVIYSLVAFGEAGWWFANDPPKGSRVDLLPAGYGFGLPGVYAVWVGVVLVLYPVCRWFADLKQRRRNGWLSYL